MQSLISPFFFLTTTIGEEKDDSDLRIIPASSNSSRCLRTASRSLGWIGLALCLKGVSSCNLMVCFTLLVCPTSMSCNAKTSGMARSFWVILFFHSPGKLESPKSKQSSLVGSARTFDTEQSDCTTLCDITFCSAWMSAITLFPGMMISCSVSFFNTTGTLRDGCWGRLSKQLATSNPPGKGEYEGGSITAHLSATCPFTLTTPSRTTFWPAGTTVGVTSVSLTIPMLRFTFCWRLCSMVWITAL